MIMPMPYYVTSAAGAFITVADAGGGEVIYSAGNNNPALGSISGDTTADGGTIESLEYLPAEVSGERNVLLIKDGGASATNINIDGVDKTLSFQGTSGSGYDEYFFADTVLVAGETYLVIIT